MHVMTCHVLTFNFTPQNYRIRRGGSRGFVLTEDSMDDDFYINSLIQEKEWLDKFRKKLNGSVTMFLE